MKLLFRRSKGVAIQRLLGDQVAEWLNVELPRVSNPRVDMLARTVSGGLCNLELQSANSGDMAWRLAEYYLRLYRRLGEHVRQVVLYVGQDPMTMTRDLVTPAMRFQYELVDVRELDGEALLASGDLGDAMLALLTRVDKERVGGRFWPEVEEMDPARREDVVTEFLIISGLRNLEGWVLEKARRLMPLSIDVILNNKVLGPAFLKKVEEESKAARAAALVEGRTQGLMEGRTEGLVQGRVEGRVEGRMEAERAFLRRVLENRFGALTASVDQRLSLATEAELSALLDRALQADSIAELFPGA